MYDVEDWKPNLSRCQHSQKNSAVISVTHVAWQKNAYQTELLFQVSQWLFFFIYVTSLMFITHLFWAVGFLWVETQSWNWNTFEFPKSKDCSLRYDCKKCSLTIFWYIDINAAISSPNNRIEKHLSLSLNIKKIQGMDFTKETWKYLCLAETIESLRSIFCYFHSNLDVYNVCFFNNYFIMGLKTYLGSQLRNTRLWITLSLFSQIYQKIDDYTILTFTWNMFQFPKGKESSLRCGWRNCNTQFLEIWMIKAPFFKLQKYTTWHGFCKRNIKVSASVRLLNHSKSVFHLFNFLVVHNVCFFNICFLMSWNSISNSNFDGSHFFGSHFAKNWWAGHKIDDRIFQNTNSLGNFTVISQIQKKMNKSVRHVNSSLKHNKRWN